MTHRMLCGWGCSADCCMHLQAGMAARHRISHLILFLAQIPNGTLSAAKENASKTMIDVLHSYRKNCSTQSSPGQLVLPEALKLAPLYHLSLSKCPAFR